MTKNTPRAGSGWQYLCTLFPLNLYFQFPLTVKVKYITQPSLSYYTTNSLIVLSQFRILNYNFLIFMLHFVKKTFLIKAILSNSHTTMILIRRFQIVQKCTVMRINQIPNYRGFSRIKFIKKNIYFIHVSLHYNSLAGYRGHPFHLLGDTPALFARHLSRI